MRRIGSALAAGAATAGLFGAFAWLNVATRPPAEQHRLESFAVDAPTPDPAAPAPAPATPRPVAVAAAAPVAPPIAPTAPAVPAPVVAVPGSPAMPVPPAIAPGASAAGTAATAAPTQATAPPAAVSPGGGATGYAARVRAWLLRHKRYPRRSRLHREEGVVQLRFVLDRAGHLLDGALVAPSRHAALDAEALAMLRRAVPYPAPPGDLRGDRIEIAAAIAFELPR